MAMGLSAYQPVYQPKKRRKNAGLNSNYQAGLGQQLSTRVTSGAITQGQAARTNSERETMEIAFGKDWRSKVYGEAGKVHDLRSQLAQNPADEEARKEYQRLLGRRKKYLQRAG